MIISESGRTVLTETTSGGLANCGVMKVASSPYVALYSVVYFVRILVLRYGLLTC
jgi:hypothetical protein